LQNCYTGLPFENCCAKDERNDKNKCAFLFQFLGALVEAGQNEVQADTSGISLPHGSYCPCAIFMA
jgi:hypothetical protein